MATEPPNSNPPLPPPPENGSREEWREWRRQQRRYYRRWGWPGQWTWFWGALLIVVGAYYLLKNLGLLYWLKDDVLWPILLIVFGLWLLVGRAVRS